MTEVTDLREKLAGELLRDAAWDMLAPHFERDAVFWVHDAALVDVAVALVGDDKDAVWAHLDSGRLSRPAPATAQGWERDGVLFEVLIVQPYVLVAPQSPAAS